MPGSQRLLNAVICIVHVLGEAISMRSHALMNVPKAILVSAIPADRMARGW